MIPIPNMTFVPAFIHTSFVRQLRRNYAYINTHTCTLPPFTPVAPLACISTTCIQHMRRTKNSNLTRTHVLLFLVCGYSVCDSMVFLNSFRFVCRYPKCSQSTWSLVDRQTTMYFVPCEKHSPGQLPAQKRQQINSIG